MLYIYIDTHKPDSHVVYISAIVASKNQKRVMGVMGGMGVMRGAG